VFLCTAGEGKDAVFDTIFGLPTHTLVNHAVVVLVPLAAIATIAVALRPRWRERYAGWMVLVNGLAVVLTFVARESGKNLFARLDSIGGAGVAAHHRQLGLALIWYVLVLFAFSLATWLVVRSRDRGPAPTIVAILTAVAAAVVVYEVIRVGDSGSRAVWENFVKNT
jgi:uncharacterized membrane protein